MEQHTRVEPEPSWRDRLFRYTGTDRTFDRVLSFTLVAAALSMAAAKFQGKAPYGRFATPKAGVSLNPRLGWWLMELPATVCFLWSWAAGWRARRAGAPDRRVALFLFAVWARHYFNRGWFFPLSIRAAPGAKASFALANSMVGALFTALHGYLNGRLLSLHGSHLTSDWFRDSRFISGVTVYEFGFWLTIHSEYVMRNLRSVNPSSAAARYKIPYGGGFELVSSPQYLGELLCWAGFSLMTWSPTALPVLMISLGNLVPRAFTTHQWYLDRFADYPKHRKALLPFML